MKKWTVLGLALVALLGCSDGLVSPDPGDPAFANGNGKGPGGGGGGGGGETDPRADFTFPTSGFGLTAVGSSLYADGVCGVEAKIFATTELSGSGDATLNAGNPRKKDRSCPDSPRRIAIDLNGDGVEDTSAGFLNTFGIHNVGYFIPVGQTAQHSLGMNACGDKLRFSDDVGGKKVFVKRTAADEWLVTTDDPDTPGFDHGVARCSASNELHYITVSFTIKSSRALDPQ